MLTVRLTFLCPRFFRLLDRLRTTLWIERSFLIWVRGMPQPRPSNMSCLLLTVAMLDQARQWDISHSLDRRFSDRFFPVSNIASMIVLYNTLWSKFTSASGNENKTIIVSHHLALAWLLRIFSDLMQINFNAVKQKKNLMNCFFYNNSKIFSSVG